MKWLLYFLAALLVALTIGTFAGNDPGRVLLVWGGWTVESSAVFFAAAIFVSVIMIHYSIRMVRNLFRLPELLRRWRGDRRSLEAEERLARGLEYLLAGQWPLAERDFRHWARRGCSPMLGYLLAARAADGQGAERRRDHYLDLANEAARDPAALALLRAELLPGLASARAELERLAESDPGVAALPVVRRTLLDGAVRRGDWPAAWRLLTAVREAGGSEDADLDDLETRIASGLMDAGSTGAEVAAAWSALPPSLRRERGMIARYVRRRLQLDGCPECEALLSNVLAKHPEPELMRLFGRVHGTNPARQLRIAEGWLKRHGPDAALLLTLGRLAARAGEQDQARKWLEESLRLQPGTEAHLELGRLHEARGDNAPALEHYRRGLALINTRDD